MCHQSGNVWHFRGWQVGGPLLPPFSDLTCACRGRHARAGSPAFSPPLSLLDAVISEAGMTEGLVIGPMSPIENDLQIVCYLPQLKGGNLFRLERRNHIGELIDGPVV